MGFKYGEAPHQHGHVAKSAANVTCTIDKRKTRDWCFGQSHHNIWCIAFDLPAADMAAGASAMLSVSFAEDSSSNVISAVYVNGTTIDKLTTGRPSLNPSLFRSATTAGEWRYRESLVATRPLVDCRNSV